MEKDILLTGVCFVFVLLKLRYENKLATGIQVAKPDFDGSKIKLINGDADERIHMVDLRGSFTGNRYDDLRELLIDNSEYKHAYVVVNLELNADEVVEKMKSKFGPVPTRSWYHIYSHDWTAEQARNWKENRRQSIIDILVSFPHLKFIVLNRAPLKWWKSQNLPMDRLIFWDVKWVALHKEQMERQEEIRKLGGFGFHNFPTEESYNDLYDLILQDAG